MGRVLPDWKRLSVTVAKDTLPEYATVGELALDGSIRPIKGALAMAMAAAKQGWPRLVVPAAIADDPATPDAGREHGDMGRLASDQPLLSVRSSLGHWPRLKPRHSRSRRMR